MDGPYGTDVGNEWNELSPGMYDVFDNAGITYNYVGEETRDNIVSANDENWTGSCTVDWTGTGSGTEGGYTASVTLRGHLEDVNKMGCVIDNRSITCSGCEKYPDISTPQLVEEIRENYAFTVTYELAEPETGGDDTVGTDPVENGTAGGDTGGDGDRDVSGIDQAVFTFFGNLWTQLTALF